MSNISGRQPTTGQYTSEGKISIQYKIQKLVEWMERYPKAIINSEKKAISALRFYAGDDEAKIEELLKEYSIMRKYYEYIRDRKSKGELTPEQEDKCKEGNIRGVFGYPSKTAELAEEYNVTPENMDLLLSKYGGDIEKFFKDYTSPNESSPQFNFIRQCLLIDLNEATRGNSAYAKLYEAIISLNDQGILFKRNIIFYDGNDLQEALEGLTDKQKKVINLRFGVEDGKTCTFEEVAKEIGVSRAAVQQFDAVAKRKLREVMRSKKIYDLSENEELQFSPEEEMQIATLIQRIYRSNIIFKPDEHCSQEPYNITSDQLMQIVVNLQNVRSGYHERMAAEEKAKEDAKIDITGIDIQDIGIEKLGLCDTTLKILRDKKIGTVLELMRIIQWDRLYLWYIEAPGDIMEEINTKLDDFASRNNHLGIKKSDDGLWMKTMGNSCASVDVGTYIKLRNADIVTDEQLEALRNLCDTGILRKIEEITDEEFNQLIQEIFAGQTVFENNARLINMGIISSDHTECLKTLGKERLESIRCEKLSNDEIEILISLGYEPEYMGGKHISVLNFSTRTYNALRLSGIMTVGALNRMNEDELRTIRRIGKKSLDEIKKKLEEFRENLVGREEDSPLRTRRQMKRDLEERCGLAAKDANKSREEYIMLTGEIVEKI